MRLLPKVAGLTLCDKGKELGHVGGHWCQVTALPQPDELRGKLCQIISILIRCLHLKCPEDNLVFRLS